MAVQDQSGELTLCPTCGRRTATVGRGACADCWQAKTSEGQPAIRAAVPTTLPLLESIDDVPLWLWIAAGAALAGGLLAALIHVL